MKYKFGDLLLKPAMRVLTNNPHYEIGDLMRGSLGGAFRDRRIRGQRRETYSAAQSASSISDFQVGFEGWHPDERPLPSRPVQPASPTSENELWGLFFEKCYDAAVAGCARGEILLEDLLDAEPFLMIGLPSVALFEAVMRTADAPAPCEGLLLSSGRALQPCDVPPSFAELLGILMHTANKVAKCKPALSEDERQFVRAFLLVSGADKVVSAEGVADQRQVELKRIFSHLVSVSTQVTRLGFYKQNFADVLEAAALSMQASITSC